MQRKDRKKLKNQSRKHTKENFDEIRTEEKNLHEKLEQLKIEQTAAQKAMEKAMIYVEEGGQKINNLT